jgi:hypothetical protein
MIVIVTQTASDATIFGDAIFGDGDGSPYLYMLQFVINKYLLIKKFHVRFLIFCRLLRQKEEDCHAKNRADKIKGFNVPRHLEGKQ